MGTGGGGAYQTILYILIISKISIIKKKKTHVSELLSDVNQRTTYLCSIEVYGKKPREWKTGFVG